ncbi:MAG TPA: DUF3037 domain-containing protein [Verrucomicrobiae bacterium]|nr:DUF3037 domain-containing protein [Verrucomicrobiae bacterium]
MANRQQCSFFLLRYVPDAVKNEFVNIGLVLLPQGGEPELRFTHDWSRVRCLDAQADVDLLDALESDLRDQLHSLNGDRDSILRRIQDSFSNALQPSEIKACLAESPALEADELARLYLDRQRLRAQREPSARQAIRDRMQQEFEKVGVWPLMWHNVEAARYTRKGDPLKIDCGYSPNGTVKLFHALALETDPNSAKVLAFSYPQLAEGILKVESKRAELAAVVDDSLPDDEEQTGFGLDILRSQKIRIVPISAMAAEARNAAAEMGI